MSAIKINKDYEVPYIGGYSEDGKTIYIDRDFPETFEDLSGQVHDAHKALIVHEISELRFLDAFGFQEAHKRALEYEQAFLRENNIPLDEYYGNLYYHLKSRINTNWKGIQQFFALPPDLDLSPYEADGFHIKGLTIITSKKGK